MSELDTNPCRLLVQYVDTKVWRFVLTKACLHATIPSAPVLLTQSSMEILHMRYVTPAALSSDTTMSPAQAKALLLRSTAPAGYKRVQNGGIQKTNPSTGIQIRN